MGEIRERVKVLFLNVILGVFFFWIDSDLNEFWLKFFDWLFERLVNSDDDYNFLDGLYNGYFFVNLGLVVMLVFRFNKWYVFGKFYLYIGYS